MIRQTITRYSEKSRYARIGKSRQLSIISLRLLFFNAVKKEKPSRRSRINPTGKRLPEREKLGNAAPTARQMQKRDICGCVISNRVYLLFYARDVAFTPPFLLLDRLGGIRFSDGFSVAVVGEFLGKLFL